LEGPEIDVDQDFAVLPNSPSLPRRFTVSYIKPARFLSLSVFKASILAEQHDAGYSHASERPPRAVNGFPSPLLRTLAGFYSEELDDLEGLIIPGDFGL
jgi:hypothetical protein